MGKGIVSLLSSSGYPVVWWGRDRKKLHTAMKGVKGYITPSTDLTDLRNVDIIIEAVVEDTQTKYALFKILDTVCGPKVIFCSNTSAIPISKLCVRLKHSARFAGLHFFNPVEKMSLVEIVRTKKTAPAVVKVLEKLATDLGKTSVIVHDAPGFVANRLLFGYLNDALLLLEKKVADQEDIDIVVEEGLHHPMGPFTLMDFIGLDVCLDVLRHLYAETRDTRFKPAPLLVRLVKKGWLGKKTKKGFYDYK